MLTGRRGDLMKCEYHLGRAAALFLMGAGLAGACWAKGSEQAPLPSVALPSALARVLGDYEVATLTLRRGADERWLIMSDMANGNSRR